MKAARFDFLKPRSLDEALAELARPDVSSRLIAGSQSLGPMLNLRLVRPERLIDLSGLPELRTVSEHEGWLRIGSAVTHAEIEDGRHGGLHDHPWQRVAGTIAYRSVRNRGTVGGSLAHADPAADWVLAAWASDALIEIASAARVRLVPVRDFMLAAYTTIIEPDEMIVALRLPLSLPEASWGYYKVCRKIGDFADASCAVVIDHQRGICRVAVGALDGPPILLEPLAEQLLARPDRSGTWADALDEHVASALPERDRVAQRMVSATVRRAVDRAFGHDGVPA